MLSRFIFLLLFVSLLFAQQETKIFKAEKHAEYVEGELLIKMKSEVTIESAKAHLTEIGLKSVRSYGKLKIEKTVIEADMTMQQALEKCKADPNIEYAEPNYIYHILETTPNDSRFNEQWALKNTGQTGGSNDADIDAPDAWDLQTGSSNILVGIIDTGVDDGHPDLQANMWRNPGESGGGKETNGIDDDGNGYVDDYRGWDFINNDNNPYDDNEHGTHVAGIIGAVGNNGQGIAGANWTVKMAGLKFLGANGSGSTSDAIEAILYGASMGFDILNNSWGGGGFSQALADAIEVANQADVLFAAAAGNDSKNTDSSPNYPSNYTSANVISVASSDFKDALSGFSNYGKTTVDLAAPGSSILSTVPNSGYDKFSGTSMATPYVAGVAALIKAQFPGIDVVSLKYRLMGGTDFKGAFVNKAVTEGRLNANGSLSTNPLITTIKHPHTTDSANPYSITAYIVDDSSINSAKLYYTLTGTTTGSDSADMTANGIKYSAQIPAAQLETTVNYYVKAQDNEGNITNGRTLSFLVTANPPPENGGGCCGTFALRLDTGNPQKDHMATVALNIFLIFVLPFFFLKRKK